MSKLVAFAFTACLLTIGASTGVSAAEPDWPKTLTLGTASPGGVYYVYGEVLAPILTEKLGVTVHHLPTQGPVHNVKLVESGGAQLGMITMGVGLQGWSGTGDWTHGQRFRQMRALIPLYDTPLQMFALRRSGVSTVENLAGKRLCVGPRAGTGGAYVPAILKTLGISAVLTYGSFAQMGEELLAGRCDAVVTALGAPIPAFREAETKEPLVFIRLSPEQMAAVRQAMPEFSTSSMPAGTYTSLDQDYDTLGLFNVIIGRSDLPATLAYQLVKTVFDNHDRLLKAHSSAKETIPGNAVKNTLLLFHPGAARYYREIGIKIPDGLVPTN